jgi:hypothetical protein
MPLALSDLGSCQKSAEALSENWQLRGFTFPNRNDPPSESSQLHLVCPVTLDSGIYLFSPKIPSCAGVNCILATGVVMPKTPVYKNDRSMTCEHDVWISGQFPLVNSKSQTVTVEK